jgi:2,4-dienoyl-CoA reductase-like NADH-dependent reductase (Old Yellow Enzyme family)
MIPRSSGTNNLATFSARKQTGKRILMTHLFSPLTIRSITLKNRIAVSPMCQYSSEDGFATDWHLVHLGSRAIGGAGLVIAEATAVSPDGRITPGDLGIWKDEHISFLKRITQFISDNGSVPGIQLAHAGRKSSVQISWEGGENLYPDTGGWETLAPSAVAFKDGDIMPREMTVADIQRVTEDFKAAAKRALEAGFKVVELHGAHGYLINEFLSPASNLRTDEYGGSFENRARFLTNIVKEVRSVWPSDLPLFVRISATDWTEKGWTEDDSVKLAKMLKEMDVDLIDCSTGGNVSGVKIPLVPLYQVPLAEKVKHEAGVLTGAVGLITTAKEAESVIAEGRADIVLMARELLRDPYFPLHAAHELGADTDWPVQYERAKPKKQQ